MGFIFGNITRIMTRYSHFDILRSPTWEGKISLSVSTLNELCFWKENIFSLNSTRLLSTQFHYSRVRYSDASSTGCTSYMLGFHNTISHKLWKVDEAEKTSFYRELRATSLGLESFLGSYYSTVLCNKFIIVYLLVCVFIITEFMSMNKLFSVRSLENNVNYVQNSIFSLQSSGQVFVSLLPFILYYFTMQCIIRNFKITLATCCKLEIMYDVAL